MSPAEELLILEALDSADVPSGAIDKRVLLLVAMYKRVCAQLDERRKKTSKERLLEMLDEDRSEIMLLLCDACIDEAHEPGCTDPERLEREAKGWGWLGSHHKFPYWFDGRWHWGGGNSSAKLPDHLLPISLTALQQLDLRRFDTARAALEAVVGIMAKGKWGQDKLAKKKNDAGPDEPFE